MTETETAQHAPKGLDYDSFYDWLQFDSPLHSEHMQALDVLRYCGPNSQTDYANRFFTAYQELNQ